MNSCLNFFKNKINLKTIIIVCLVASFILGGVLVTVSYLKKSNLFINEFEVGTVDVKIVETFSNDTKENVFVSNEGDVPIYVRTLVNIYWIDSNNVVENTLPVENIDYSIDYGTTNWVKGQDGYYYYTIPVLPDQDTTNIIDLCQQLTSYQDKKLVVDVVSQCIQKDPSDAVEDSWNVTVENDGSITPNS